MVRKRRSREIAASDSGRGQRRLRVGEALRHALVKMLRDGECRDPALIDAAITVTEISVSPDLRNACAYVMPLGGGNGEEIIAALRRSAPFLRGRLAREVPLRHAPQLAFALDRSFDHAERIAALLARPEVARDLESSRGAEGDVDGER